MSVRIRHDALTRTKNGCTITVMEVDCQNMFLVALKNGSLIENLINELKCYSNTTIKRSGQSFVIIHSTEKDCLKLNHGSIIKATKLEIY